MNLAPVIHDVGFTVYCGDSRVLLGSLPSESVDCIVTSPPYYHLREYGVSEWNGGDETCDHTKPISGNAAARSTLGTIEIIAAQHKECYRGTCGQCGAVETSREIGQEDTIVEYVESLCGIFAECHRLLKPTGSLWLNIADTWESGEMQCVPWTLAFAMRKNGWRIIADVIWNKTNGLPESQSARPSKTHEYVFLFAKSKGFYYQIRKGQPRVRTVWSMPVNAERGFSEGHFALYPAELARQCIRLGCPPDGVVLDPFLGLGTTIVAARSLGRESIGVEMSHELIGKIASRLKTVVIRSAGDE